MGLGIGFNLRLRLALARYRITRDTDHYERVLRRALRARVLILRTGSADSPQPRLEADTQGNSVVLPLFSSYRLLEQAAPGERQNARAVRFTKVLSWCVGEEGAAVDSIRLDPRTANAVDIPQALFPELARGALPSRALLERTR